MNERLNAYRDAISRDLVANPDTRLHIARACMAVADAEQAGLKDVPSAQAASVLLDLLGPETFANEAVTFVIGQLGSLSEDQAVLVKVGAVKAAIVVADEVRRFAGIHNGWAET